jgi:sulfur relay (sulfurtransferase) complex TusBCD TusD component (DsrE family)
MPAQHQYGDNELVLNYNDAVIYGKDLGLLAHNTAWLNDACIHYQLTRLQQTHDPAAKSILFLDPAVVSFLMHQVEDDDEMRDFTAGYHHFEVTKRIFVPINDNMGSQHWQTPGLGSHWSLLLVLLSPVSSSSSSSSSSTEVEGTTTPLFFHFDSVTGSNQKAAHAVATKLYQAWEMTRMQQHVHAHEHRSVQRDLEQTTAEAQVRAHVQVQSCASPQQRNGYDCGLHLLANAQGLAECTDTDLIVTNTTVTGLTDMLEQQLANQSLLLAEHLRAVIAQDIRRRAASAS